MDVIRRLDYLIEMGEQLVNTPDPSGFIPNIKAIINAYRTRRLEWNEGLVTYWSKGKQLCEPRPFHYGEFLDVNKQHDGHNDFWVEGMQYLFLDDSGAEATLIYDQDIVPLRKTPAGTVSQLPPLMGSTLARGALGGQGTLHQIRAMEVNMVADTIGNFMTLWDWIPVTIHTVLPKKRPPPRLSGPWHRYKFYTGSAPDGTGRTWAFNLKKGWDTLVPTVTNVLIAPRPDYSAWGGVPAAANASAGAPVSARPAKAPPPRVLVAPNPAGLRRAPLNQAALINVPPAAGLAPAVIAAKASKAAPKAAPKATPKEAP
ncbi:hypothetical protein PENSUB_3899 [Penicillium subrubescens]|uniref:Uncharacterized protein n=1 Tax=Penicillium subrubescens TaxID=1316194 RepID=A0A1Q5UDN9_9EURO|nr:hypothetical protein PENSUB_3899 [Penicillium subrubescens]